MTDKATLEEIEAVIARGFEPNFGWDDLTHKVVHGLLEICREQGAELERRPRVGSCVWTLVETIDDAEWSSTCGHEWQFLDGGPKENEVKFCPFCGGEVEIEEPKEG